MLIMVYGGSGSGKSAYAEKRMVELSQADARIQHEKDAAGMQAVIGENDMIYLATMQVCDADSERRVSKHRAQRAGKGFRTIEKARNIAEIFDEEEASINAERQTAPSTMILLECMSNLVANELFQGENTFSAAQIADKIMQDILAVYEHCSHLVIVTNNVFEDGVAYDAEIAEYLQALAQVNAFLAARADEVIEVVAGIPVVLLCR